MTAPRIVGLDLSLTSTGVALTDGSTWLVTTNAAARLEVRLDTIVKGIDEAIDACHADDGERCDLVVIEDMVTASKFSGSVAPVHGAVRLWLWHQEIPVALMAPGSLKKYATGDGSCGKTDMALAAQKRVGIEFGKGRDDECDAWWLRAAALDAYGYPIVSLPAVQRNALEKVTWPSLPTLDKAVS